MKKFENYINKENVILNNLLNVLNKEKNFVKYFFLRDVLKKSIRNINNMMIKTFKDTDGIFEISEDYRKDQVSVYGASIFNLHLKRKVDFDDFFSITKRYRQVYIELFNKADIEDNCRQKYLCFLNCFFDKIEIGIILEWAKILKESEERYRKLFDLTPDAVLVHSDGEVLLANHIAGKLFKFNKPEDLKGKSIFDLLHMDYWGTAMERIKKTLDQEEDAPLIEYKCIRSDKKIVDVEVTTTSFKYIGKPALLSVIRDISERKILEEEYQKNEKLESLGILAGGIAHDFNNILTVIQGNISLLNLHLKRQEIENNKINEINKAMNQAKHLTQQLLTFSNGGNPNKKKMQLERLIKDAVNLCICGSKVKCKIYQNEKLLPVEIDGGQVFQVLNNIIINAVQSMPHGGKIIIESKNIYIESEKQQINNILKKGKYVMVSIKDEGVGIPSKNIKKIFDPFYTTKENGTGLGLTTAFSIMKKHGGIIKVDSKAAVGTTFSLYFPVSVSKEELISIGKDKIIYTGKGKILLMDDNYAVREVLGQMLFSLGYDVDFAKNGEEAISLFKKTMNKKDGYIVSILDLTVPGGKGGLEIIKEILQIDPNAKVVVASGYSDSPIKIKYKEYGFKAFISKPFEIEILSEKLQQVVNFSE
jgi:PAS domain S-box-containing protein